jgi:hypothetical protein
MAFQTDPWRGLTHAASRPDDSFSGWDARFRNKGASHVREALLETIIEQATGNSPSGNTGLAQSSRIIPPAGAFERHGILKMSSYAKAA